MSSVDKVLLGVDDEDNDNDDDLARFKLRVSRVVLFEDGGWGEEEVNVLVADVLGPSATKPETGCCCCFCEGCCWCLFDCSFV
jgi:hypothetical protein